MFAIHFVGWARRCCWWVNMGTLTGDEFSSSIILWFKFEAGFELIIYAVGENLIERGFGFCLHGAWEFDKCPNEFPSLLWLAIRYAHVEIQVLENVWCGRRRVMMISRSTQTTSRHSRPTEKKTFINHEHLLNRSPLLFCASGSPAKSVNGNCVMNYERWKQRTNAKESEENNENSEARCFQSNRLARLLFFCFRLILESLLRLCRKTQRFLLWIDELICRFVHMRTHLRRWESQVVLIEN